MNLPQPHEILYRQSSDGGNTFGSTVNLSNTPGESLIPSIAAAAENSVYLVWVKEGEIFYRASINPFAPSETINLSNSGGNSGIPTIAVS